VSSRPAASSPTPAAPAPDPEELRRDTLKIELCKVVAIVEAAPLHQLDEIFHASLKKVLEMTAEDNTILHEGNLVGRFTFASEVVAKLNMLKQFSGSASTWQFLPNDNSHKTFQNGERNGCWRFVCTVEIALIIVGNANHESLKDTGNFVVTDSAVISSVSERGLWRLQCPFPKRTLPSKELQQIKEESELRCCRFYLPENTKFISVNGFELGEQWLDCIDEYQLQSLPKTVVTDNDLTQFVTLWYDLISDEKTRQRVCKGRDYAFADEGMNLPWKFVEPQGVFDIANYRVDEEDRHPEVKLVLDRMDGDTTGSLD